MLRRLLLALALFAPVLAAPPPSSSQSGDGKLDAELLVRAHVRVGRSRVIIRTSSPESLNDIIRRAGGRPGRRLPGANSQVADVPDSALGFLAGRSDVEAVSLDRPVHGTLERTARTIGARWVQQNLGFDGTGVGVATIDSGVTSSHDDLSPDRIAHFADFVNFESVPYDDYGHGTHVAGIIAGSGFDSSGARRGIAPGASLIVLKALDASGGGFISNVIEALDYAIANRAALNIRVINLSVAAGVYESYNSDPLALAARRAVDAGIVVIASAGNYGLSSDGRAQSGGITSPGNAPWVLTVGASSHAGTTERSDDVVAAFSSRGPSAIDLTAKPDVIAPGVGIESTTQSTTLLYAQNPAARLWGTVTTKTEPYLSLSGTSMAAPVVAGTVALMLEANPSLTPNAVKAILQFTAETKRDVSLLAQGAGFLNARGAVELARVFGETDSRAADAPARIDPVTWNRHIIWGNRRIGGGSIVASANAWKLGVTWGDLSTADGKPIVWGTACAADETGCGDRIWGTGADRMTWGTSDDLVRAADCLSVACTGVVWDGPAERQ